MPLFDMPFEKMLTYQGTNPKPSDHEEYWNRALNEMHSLGTDCKLVPADFSAPNIKCFDLWFIGVKGANIYSKLLVPDGEGPFPAVLMFHGYTGASYEWVNYMPYAQSGFVVAALDCRGQAGKSEDVGGVKGNTMHGQIIRGMEDENPDKLLTRALFLDTAQLARVVMALPYVDENRVAATGGSQGGALTIACAALEPKIERLVSVYPFMSDYKRVHQLDLSVNAYKELSEYFRKFDPMHKRANEIFTKLGYIDIQHLAHRIKGKTLMFTGLMDTICPPSTQFAAYNKITAPKEYRLWPDFAHESLPGADDQTFTFISELL